MLGITRVADDLACPYNDIIALLEHQGSASPSLLARGELSISPLNRIVTFDHPRQLVTPQKGWHLLHTPTFLSFFASVDFGV
jgi:hypothetical protein